MRPWLVYLMAAGQFPFGKVACQSKRGVAYVDDGHQADEALLFSERSPISWYYTWSLDAAEVASRPAVFVPLIHNRDDASNPDLASLLDHLPASSTHLLTFNEPDGETDTGGSSISPEDAAQSYITRLARYRTSDRPWRISHPAVTGSDRGLTWLREFNASCWAMDADDGCPLDFVAVHWYGDAAGLATWLDTLHAWYGAADPNVRLWVTEMALPQQDEADTLAMLNQSLVLLDGLDYVERYAWFGAFREGHDAGGWTGDEVSLFDGDGALTEVGSLYLGEENGFEEGMRGASSRAAMIRARPKGLQLAVVSLATFCLLV